MNPRFRAKVKPPVNNFKEHGWYYYPKMTATEAVIFKQYDTTARESQVCIHAAIEMDEDGPKPLPERQSVEVRAIVLFDDVQAVPSAPTSVQIRDVQIGYQK